MVLITMSIVSSDVTPVVIRRVQRSLAVNHIFPLSRSESRCDRSLTMLDSHLFLLQRVPFLLAAWHFGSPLLCLFLVVPGMIGVAKQYKIHGMCQLHWCWMEKSGALYQTHVEFYTIAMVILTVIICVKCHHAIINFQHHRHGGILRGD